MRAKGFNVNLTSEDPQRLDGFYQDVVQLERDPISGGFKVGDSVVLLVDGHSETRGPAKEPHRYLINFMVEDLSSEQARLEAQGVRFIRTAGREYWGGVISTFLDPDGNYCQLIEYRPG
jgi:predicted enzyme related to lactoylglutathione lyase